MLDTQFLSSKEIRYEELCMIKNIIDLLNTHKKLAISRLKKCTVEEYIEDYKGLLKKSGNPAKEKILFIGDELEKDIKGGIENNIDTCWCNYNNENKSGIYVPKYEIHKLEELKQIL